MYTFYVAEMLNHILHACNNTKPWGIVLSGAPSVNRTDPEYPKAGAVRNGTVELLVELNVYPDPDEMTWWRTTGSENTALPSDGYQVDNTGASSKLIISNVQEDQFGNYTLTVTNMHGSLRNEDGDEGVTFEVTAISKYSLRVICCKQILSNLDFFQH